MQNASVNGMNGNGRMNAMNANDKGYTSTETWCVAGMVAAIVVAAVASFGGYNYVTVNDITTPLELAQSLGLEWLYRIAPSLFFS